MDIGITWNYVTGYGDWSIANHELVRGNDLESAVYVSLFSDGRAQPDYRPPEGHGVDHRGFWADTYFPGPGTGSRLWTLERSKKTNDRDVLNKARDICNEALQWLITDRVVATVTVTPSWLTPTTLAIRIILTKPDGILQRLDFAWAWDTPGS